LGWVLGWPKRRFNTEGAEKEHRGHREEEADLKDRRYIEEGGRKRQKI
jgi:hypothetical protein